MTSDRSRLTWWWLGAGIALTLAKLWLTRSQTIFAIGQAGHDDRLFLLLAQSIANGEWLGAYNQLTLAKGPFYPLWIAAVSWLGVPLLVANQVAYATACAVFVRACRPAIASGAALLALYALLLWNPASFEASSLGRVLRQHVNLPQVVFIFAALVGLYVRREEIFRRQLPWAVTLGLAFSSFWLTREEAVFLVPALALLGGACVLGAWADFGAWRRMLASFAVAAAVFSVPVVIVSAMNYRHYGWFGTVEFRAAEFKDAYGAMLRVQIGPQIPYVPVTRQAREAMYAVSPTFARLRPFLDGNIGRDWAEGSSTLTGTAPDERQIGGGWLMWALRDSVAAAGEAKSARDALRFYRRMAREINAACDDGRLPAGPRRSGFVPPWREGDGLRAARTFGEFARFVVNFAGFSVRAGASEGTDEDFVLFRDLTRERIEPRAGEMEIMGPATAGLHQRNIARLEVVSEFLRRWLPWLLVIAQFAAVARAVQLLLQRRWTFPLTLALAAWSAAAAGVLIHAIIHVTSFPVLVISSFAAIYPLLTIFIGAVGWELATVKWKIPRWRPSTPEEIAATAIPEPARPAVPAWAGRVVALAGLGALLPFLLWQRSFAELMWFGDDFQLTNEIAQSGMTQWTFQVFSENFVPLFKILWGSALIGFDGSYAAMLGLLWLTHAANTWLLGRVLLRAGLPWLAVLLTQLGFGLLPANIETLGWSVQWSAVLAMTFLLCGLLWQDKAAYRAGGWSWRVHGPLVFAAAASACSFSRGVLTGGVLAAAVLLPALAAASLRATRARLGPAIACLLPSLAIALIIANASRGNHQDMTGHWGDAVNFATRYFLLNPFYLIVGEPALTGATPVLLGIGKIVVLVAGWWVARGHTRIFLLLLLIYDLGNALLIGVGRFHTGEMAALSSRYNYSSLMATLPFASLLIARAREMIRPVRVSQIAAAALVAATLFFVLRGWPRALREFVGWRGTEMRALLAQPYVADPKASVPGVEFLHVERAKALQRAFNLH